MTFPNFKNKHTEKPVFSPDDYLAYRKKIGYIPKYQMPAGIIFCYSPMMLKLVQKNFRTTPASGFKGEMYLLNETDNKIAIIGNFGYGAPVAANLLEEFIVFGVREFISIGMAGTLQKNIPVGGIVVCDKAIRDEGVSHHYVQPEKYAHASARITGKITKSLEKADQKYVTGASWTTDAPFMETVEEVKQYQSEGVATVDMEASALFAIAQYRNVEIGAIFAISDSLADLKWDPKFHAKATNKGLEIICKTAVDALCSD